MRRKPSAKSKSGGKQQHSSSRKPQPPPPASLARTAKPAPAPPLNLGLDLGGSLTKICYFQPSSSSSSSESTTNEDENGNGEADELDSISEDDTTGSHAAIRDHRLSFTSKQFAGKFHFIYFHTSATREAISVIKTLAHSNTVGSQLHATGGGAIKFAKFIKQELGVTLVAEDELETVVRGIVFTLLEHPKTCYSLDPQTFTRVEVGQDLNNLFPLLVVNIGSGVSIIKVDSPESMRRVSGTAVGGGTFYGLCKLLTRCETFDEAMDMADRGDANAVNMLVSDIYGGSYERVGLLGSITASFFGKAAAGAGARARPASSGSHEDVLTARRERGEGVWYSFLRASAPYHFLIAVLACMFVHWLDNAQIQLAFLAFTILTTFGFTWYLAKRRRAFRKSFPLKTSKEEVFQDEDIAKALVTMISQNVTQIAYLNARMHQTKRIVFTGNFLRHNAIALRTLTSNLALFSGGEIEALFTEHEGFFGALGAFLMSESATQGLEQSAKDNATAAAAASAAAVVPKRSSFHAPEEGDDGFFLSSPQITSYDGRPTAKSLDDGFVI